MPFRNILVTGGAGFVGSNLAQYWMRDSEGQRVIALDNLSRRGSELALPRLRESGVRFVHGDVRNPEDLDAVGEADLVLDCSAEPSVQAGYDDPRYLINTNLAGTLNCLEFARSRGAAFVFLSSSRVYPIPSLRALPLEETADRFALAQSASGPGWSSGGISEDFPLAGTRSLYGATKLSAELFVQEYASAYGLRAVVNRCGVLAGPWQMGKVDQGFAALWAAQFLYGGRLSYNGFGGGGKQVRDILHIADLFDLIRIQAGNMAVYSGGVYNVGGGTANSVSLLELSRLCAAISGRSLSVGSDPHTHPADIPYYVSDNGRIASVSGWAPRKPVESIVQEIFAWLADYRPQLEPLLRRD